MKLTTTCLVALLTLVGSTAAAQQQTGEIFGRATDSSGAVLPGTTVTAAGPALLQPRVAVTSETGSYRMPELPIGTYTVTFELPGFRTLQMTDVRITIGFSAQVNAQMELSTVQETVTVTGESPLIDTKSTGTRSSFDLDTLQNLPTARDPWVMLEKTPGITMDRANVGGSQSGQQSGYISRGASTGNNKWSIDGVDITDMSATGASPIYYDFDMLEEMQVTTGGADASQQTGGVGINLVTKGGTDRFRGNARFLVTDEEFQADNITDEIRAAGAGSGAPIQNIKDYGFDIGGPIVRGRAWFWGSYGTQDVKVGVVGFYKDTPTCRPTPPTDTAGLRACLETDLTELNNYNWKITYSPFEGNRLGFQNTWAEKVRNARDASDTRPIETTYRQKAVSSAFGKFGWVTGPSPFWKVSDQHVFSDRFLVDVQWAHLGNNFTLDFHEDSLATVQPRFETTTGIWGRSYQQSIFMRPTNSVDVTTNYFLPNFMSGDHAFKAGFRWRTAHSTSINHYGGNAVARYTNGVPNSADMYRDGYSESHLDTLAFYAQDSYTVKRFTFNIGFRLDIQGDEAVAAEVPASPILPVQLPSVSFAGADAGVTWKDFSPRLGLTYDISGTGRTVANASYATYFGQMAPGQLSSELAATGQVFVRYPWADANNDGFVQAGELNLNTILSRSAAYNPANPSNSRSAGTVDENIKNDRTREFIVGINHELRPGLGVGASYIWRKYDRFNWQDRVGLTSADYVAVNYQATTCPTGARCEAITYYQPTIPLPAAFIRTNVPDRYRDYNGFELTMAKRMSNRWAMSGSFAYNSAVDHWDSPNAYEDPTNIEQWNGAQYAPEAAGSGIDSVFPNAKWLVKLNGSYQLPYGFNVGVGYQGRQGYPFPQGILTPNRANQAGQTTVLLDPLGDVRLDNFHQVDLRIDRPITVGRARIIPAMDVFNLSNVNTVLAYRRNQAASNANRISGIVAPRVIRFGVRVTF
ncbi:MAG: TonB-dependent receptor [Acidobacteria bacterium]|nr:TonB-dependent receptor [Acidobacteriota bacterium]